MSESQYYEFLAVDRPLDEARMKPLRRISKQAELTSTRFVHTFERGGFRADPYKLLVAHFDLMVHVASWGTRRLLVRLPAPAIEPAAARAYGAADVFTVGEHGGFLVLAFDSRVETAAESGVAPEAWMPRLAPVRAELLGGDRRVLYLGWLLGAQSGEFEDGETEPPVPPGLRELSAAQRALGEFVRLDPDLLKVASARSEALGASERAARQAWIATLPAREKNRLLLQVLDGAGAELGEALRRRFEASAAAHTPRRRLAPRTVAGLARAARRHGLQRETPAPPATSSAAGMPDAAPRTPEPLSLFEPAPPAAGKSSASRRPTD